MNRKGFTLIELLATFVILSIVVGLSVYSIGNIFGNAKKKSEDVFVGTIKDALDVYLTSSAAKGLNYSTECTNTLKKSYNPSVKVYKVNTNFSAVINSEFKPITQKDLVNPANKDVSCNSASSIDITVYRDEDYVYYYSVNKCSFGCLNNVVNKENGSCDNGSLSNIISNLPEGFVC